MTHACGCTLAACGICPGFLPRHVSGSSARGRAYLVLRRRNWRRLRHSISPKIRVRRHAFERNQNPPIYLERTCTYAGCLCLIESAEEGQMPRGIKLPPARRPGSDLIPPCVRAACPGGERHNGEACEPTALGFRSDSFLSIINLPLLASGSIHSISASLQARSLSQPGRGRIRSRSWRLRSITFCPH